MPRTPAALTRWCIAALGGVAFVVGAIGIVVPLLPTTIFWIIAAGCFAHSCPAFERALYEHPRFGSAIRNFREQGAISPAGKTAALAGMTASLLVVAVVSGAKVLPLVTPALAAAALYVYTRPEPVQLGR